MWRRQVRPQLPKHKLLIYTGPIDAYYASLGLPKLEYRSLRFEKEFHEPESGYYQEALQARARAPRRQIPRNATPRRRSSRCWC